MEGYQSISWVECSLSASKYFIWNLCCLVWYTSLLQFYDRVLDVFVSTWYSQFTDSNEFMNELRFSFKYATATLVNRILETDYVTVITDQLVPQVMVILWVNHLTAIICWFEQLNVLPLFCNKKNALKFQNY